MVSTPIGSIRVTGTLPDTVMLRPELSDIDFGVGRFTVAVAMEGSVLCVIGSGHTITGSSMSVKSEDGKLFKSNKIKDSFKYKCMSQSWPHHSHKFWASHAHYKICEEKDALYGKDANNFFAKLHKRVLLTLQKFAKF